MNNNSKKISKCSFDDIKEYYNNVLNTDTTTFISSNDTPTPIECVEEMLSKLPEEFYKRDNLKVLDPCCGDGNFCVPLYYKFRECNFTHKNIIDNILYFNDINEKRLENVKNIFGSKHISNLDYTNDYPEDVKFDLILANPPYAKLMENGKRASKNHNLISIFIEKTLKLLKPNGYLLFITPDNWMSYASRNILIEKLTALQIIHLDIHTAKKYFKKIGSSFTWYIIQNCKFSKDFTVSGIWKKVYYESLVTSQERKYIPLYYNKNIQSILSKTIDNTKLKKFNVETSSYLHKYTKKELINDTKTTVFKYKLIHTPKQTVYASKPHIYQDGYKVFISTTDKYQVFIDDCGMTQSIVFIRCKTLKEAEEYSKILNHPLYIFLNNICRWGNFNNIKILKSFPIPENNKDGDIFEYFKLTNGEINLIQNT